MTVSAAVRLRYISIYSNSFLFPCAIAEPFVRKYGIEQSTPGSHFVIVDVGDRVMCVRMIRNTVPNVPYNDFDLFFQLEGYKESVPRR